MKISVIIPAYNEEENITATLDALLACDYPDFEVIVIDNASKDKTFEVASKKNVKVIREERKGTMWACEAGRKIATGEIVARLDADCLPEKNWLAKGARWFADKKVSAVSGPYDYFDGPSVFRYFALGLQKYIYVPLNYFLIFFRIGGITIGGNTFMRAASLEKIHGFDTSITFYGDDTDVAKRLSTVGKVIFDGSLVIKTSARRFKSEGMLTISAKYVYHFFKVIFIS